MKKFVAELIGYFYACVHRNRSCCFGNGVEGLGHLGIALAFGLAIVVAAFLNLELFQVLT